jgi:drug/metabolite transporter (DMT)-like permease
VLNLLAEKLAMLAPKNEAVHLTARFQAASAGKAKLNLTGIRQTATFQKLRVIATLCGLGVLIFAGLFGAESHVAVSEAPATLSAASIGTAMLLVLLTLVWGLNWPVMKLGVTGFPPLTFRTLCMWIGLPVLWAFLMWRRTPMRIAREHWRELLVLTVFNMLFWHTLAILAIQTLSSGRAAILGYTMPVFSAVLGAVWFSQRLSARAWAGVSAAAGGVLLLLWHEFTALAGKPQGVAMMLVAAATWALGTQLLRRTRIPAPTLAISFWMLVLTTAWMTVAAVLFESSRWVMPTPTGWGAIGYNAIGVFAFAQVVWL